MLVMYLFYIYNLERKTTLRRQFRQTSRDGKFLLEVFYESKGKKVTFAFHGQRVANPDDLVRLCSAHHGKKIHWHKGLSEEIAASPKDTSYGTLLRLFKREFKARFGGEAWNSLEM